MEEVLQKQRWCAHPSTVNKEASRAAARPLCSDTAALLLLREPISTDVNPVKTFVLITA
jgi:hypothetical protein